MLLKPLFCLPFGEMFGPISHNLTLIVTSFLIWKRHNVILAIISGNMPRGCYSDCLDKFLPVNLDLRSISTLNLQYSNIEKFVEEISRMGFQLNVERLKLSFTYQTDTITPALVHLLQSCPKLCRLDLNVSALEEMEIRYNRAFSKLLSKLQGVAQTNKMLRTLKLDSFSGWQSEILFIKEVLAYFSALEKLFIIFASYNQTEEFKFGVMQQLLHFPRASTKAEIVVLHFPHAYPTKAEIDVI
ncbi:PREDICTED: uncharacterized protein LOC109158376 isoform X2 [Ipomoea nil]|uniref:uncharacterized protein LOC109158376 isoform X2 n=1 Tax=Ipomoea nil TaxID=35883 RepID=UPI000901D648|nr:PREDICTED: uncharacterized protein LOC109158376 isoform X2 [Ipomoea nil]